MKPWTTPRLFCAAALLLSLVGCEGMALRDAQLQDSPEAYEEFLERYPDSVEAADIRLRVEELRFLRAKAARNSAALREYLSHHPDGKNVEEARRLEDELAWKEAAGHNTVEWYTTYLDSHPDGQFVEDARFAHGQLVYIPKMSVGELTVERVNMANDPKGPLNGWGVSADISNNGDRSLEVVEIAIDYLDGSGVAVKSDKWWAVAPNLGGYPIRPEMLPKLHPKQSRTFRWTTAEQPEGYVGGKFGLRVTRVGFVKD